MIKTIISFILIFIIFSLVYVEYKKSVEEFAINQNTTTVSPKNTPAKCKLMLKKQNCPRGYTGKNKKPTWESRWSSICKSLPKLMFAIKMNPQIQHQNQHQIQIQHQILH